MNQHTTIHYGDHEIQFNDLDKAAKAIDYVKQLGFELPIEGHKYSIAQSMLCSKDIYQLRKDSSNGTKFLVFSGLLLKTKSCKATNARDKVYSLLGLVDDEEYPVSIDYGLPVEKVIRDVTSIVFKTENKLSLLALCQNPERYYNLPSWAPNLLNPWKSKPFQTGKYGYLRHKETENFVIEGEVLKAQGVLWQKLDQICDTIVPENATVEQLKTAFDAWQDFVDELESSRKNYSQDATYALTYGLVSSHKYHLQEWARFLSVDQYRPLREDWVPLDLKSLDQRFRSLDTKSIRSFLVGANFAYYSKENADVLDLLYEYGRGRRLGVTSDGFVGLFPASAQIGDNVALIRAAPMPCLLRIVKSSGDYVLVDEVHIVRIGGWHNGKRMDLNMSVEDIRIV
jgi:hypothetical protein